MKEFGKKHEGIETFRIGNLNRKRELVKEKFSKVLPGWEVIPIEINLRNFGIFRRSVKDSYWMITKKLGNGSKAEILIDVYINAKHKRGKRVSFTSSEGKEEKKFSLEDLKEIEFNYESQVVIFWGEKGSYSIENGKKHEFVSKDGSLNSSAIT